MAATADGGPGGRIPGGRASSLRQAVHTPKTDGWPGFFYPPPVADCKPFDASPMIPDEHSTPLTGVDRPTNADGVTPIGDPTDTLRIPVIDEQLVIDKQVVTTGQVRLIKTVEEDQQTIDIPLLAEQIDVERVVVDQFVDEAPATRQEGDTTIYPVLREEYVIQKRLRLVEEIRVTKRQVSTTDQQTVVLRHERIAVERTPADPFSERTGSGNEPSL